MLNAFIFLVLSAATFSQSAGADSVGEIPWINLPKAITIIHQTGKRRHSVYSNRNILCKAGILSWLQLYL